MNRAAALLLLSSLTLAVSAAGAHAQDAAPSYQLTSVPGPTGGVEWGRVEGVIDASTDDVLRILRDYAKYAGLFPHFQTSKVLSQRGTDAIVYLEAKVLHGAATLWGQVKMHAASQGGSEVIDVKMMKGKSNIAEFLARWEVSPLAGGARTKVVFQVLIDPDLPVPNSVVNGELKRSAGRAFRALRDRAAKAPVYAARASNAM